MQLPHSYHFKAGLSWENFFESS